MFQNRFIAAAASVALCGALVVPAGCKKKEETKPVAAAAEPAKKDEPVKLDDKAAPAAVVAPAQPDVELQGAEAVVGWLSFKSYNGMFDAIEGVGGRLGLLPPGGGLRTQVTAQLTAFMATAGVKDIAWFDMSKPLHIGFHDQHAAAAPGTPPNPMEVASGVFLLLPVTSKDAALTALKTAGAKVAAEAEGHEAMLTTPKGEKVYFDFIKDYTVITVMDKDRYAKISTFAGNLAKVDVPAVAYMGIAIDELVKSRKAEVDAFLGMIEAKSKDSAGGNAQLNAQAMGMYMKMMRTWLTDATRFELLIGADPANLRVEARLQARDGSKLVKQLLAGKGRTTAAVTNLLPANSYLSFAASADPATSLEQMDESLLLLKEAFKMDQPTYDATSKDMKELAKLQDGNSAVGLYPDGPAALGMLAAIGSTDGASAMKVGKRVVIGILGHVMKLAKDEQVAKGNKPSEDDAKLMAVFEQALKEGKLEPVLTAIGPKAAEAGLKLTTNSTTEGDLACDVLDATIDYAKMPPDSAQVKTLMGDKLAMAICAGKSKLSFAFGPSALEKAKAAASAKAGGLSDAPAYKAAVGGKDGATVVYLNPGAALAAFKAIVPPTINIPGDKAVLFACTNRTKSFACGFDVPVDLVKSAMEISRGGAAPAPGGMVAPAPVAPAPAPTK
jgi:hypothetical protein